jgi:lactoylglutathione lyase
MTTNKIVRELRTVYTVENYARAVRFYRDSLGLSVVKSWDEAQGSGMILDAGRATLELLSLDMAAYIDSVEVGRRLSGPIRFALEVDDSELTAKNLVAEGALKLATGPHALEGSECSDPDGGWDAGDAVYSVALTKCI